jgi:cellulose synthase (UDP-forming)
MQRLNYFSTLWYWFYGFPRMVYLMAPLLFLLLGLQPLVVRNLEELLTYYLPHLAVSIVAFQLVNRGMRRIFWSDVYESCISVQVALTAVLFPFQARKVNFKVTPKGDAAADSGSARLAFPLTILAALLIAGFLVGVTRLAGVGTGDNGTLINTIWTAYNLVVLGMGLLLLRDRPQRRHAPRLPRLIPSQLAWNGTQVEARTLDLSETGASLQLTPARSLPDHLDVTLAPADGLPLTLRGRLVRCDVDENGILSAAIDFMERNEGQHRRLVELMFSAPDSWHGPHGRTMGAPEHLMRILRSLVAIFARERRLRRLAPRYRCALAATILQPDNSEMQVRVMDISERGAALRLPRQVPVPSPERFWLCLNWNDAERTTLTARIRDVRRGAAGERLLGVVFVEVNRQQREDLRKQLYSPQQQPETLAGELTS